MTQQPFRLGFGFSLWWGVPGNGFHVAEDARFFGLSRGETMIGLIQPNLPDEAERAETLLAAINYAIEESIDTEVWLRAWVQGDRDAMQELDAWRRKEHRSIPRD